jgi:hypothetical protein
MSDRFEPRRGKRQFSLRTLLSVVACLGAALAGLFSTNERWLNFGLLVVVLSAGLLLLFEWSPFPDEPGTAAGNDATVERGKSGPRWFRFAFSLRTLFVVLTILAVWFAWTLNRLQEREAYLRYISAQFGSGATMADAGNELKPWKELPVTWRWLGTKPVTHITLSKSVFVEDDRQAIQRVFPEATVVLQ